MATPTWIVSSATIERVGSFAGLALAAMLIAASTTTVVTVLMMFG